MVLAGCTSGEVRQPAPRPTDAQQQQLVAVERAYRTADPGFAAQRDELASDPTTALWLTRLFIRDLVVARDARDPGRDEQVLRAAARIKDPTEVRALEQIDALGARALPCIVEDLLKNRQGPARELGIELCGRLGEAALPSLEPLLQDSEVRTRRAAVRGIGAVPPSAQTLQLLRRSSGDSDYTVRADAVRGLAVGGAGEAMLLRKVLAEDSDPFVRRVAAQSLGRHRDQATAMALVSYLERCQREHEPEGAQAAQAALQELSGSKGTRTLERWRQWAATWTGAAPPEPPASERE
jgi:hypothetical protein